GKSSGAPSWRRSVETSPRCVRWPSIVTPGAAASGRGSSGGGGRPPRGRRDAAGRGAVAARPQAGVRKALRLHAQTGLLQPDGILDRAAPLAAGEDLRRLREVPFIPALRAIRDDAATRRAERDG